jgi:hypothetical protein
MTACASVAPDTDLVHRTSPPDGQIHLRKEAPPEIPDRKGSILADHAKMRGLTQGAPLPMTEGREARGKVMRLFYQTLGMSRGSTVGELRPVAAQRHRAGSSLRYQIDIFGLAPHRAVADQYRYLEFLDTSEVIENGLKAQADGYDALLIGNFFQPGLHELRELLSIPVLGLAESSVSMACLMGPTFSLINVNPKFNRRIVDGITPSRPVGPDDIGRDDDGGTPRRLRPCTAGRSRARWHRGAIPSNGEARPGQRGRGIDPCRWQPDGGSAAGGSARGGRRASSRRHYRAGQNGRDGGADEGA